MKKRFFKKNFFLQLIQGSSVNIQADHFFSKWMKTINSGEKRKDGKEYKKPLEKKLDLIRDI
jgi:hypothetical protein